jgi:hypothetical protein
MPISHASGDIGPMLRSLRHHKFIAFEQRFVYWSPHTFEQDPILGVVQVICFLFSDMLPNQPYDEQREVIIDHTGEGAIA